MFVSIFPVIRANSAKTQLQISAIVIASTYESFATPLEFCDNYPSCKIFLAFTYLLSVYWQ